LAGRLQKKTAPAASGVERIKPKSLSEMRQSRATTLAKEHFALVKDSTRGHLFLAKYRDVLLRKDGVTRIITSVHFDETQKKWTVRAARAKRHKYDSRIYEVDTATRDEITIEVGRQKEQVGAFIKEHNNLTSS
jgi:hypothetical protein